MRVLVEATCVFVSGGYHPDIRTVGEALESRHRGIASKTSVVTAAGDAPKDSLGWDDTRGDS
jgi:hypothetical protein